MNTRTFIPVPKTAFVKILGLCREGFNLTVPTDFLEEILTYADTDKNGELRRIASRCPKATAKIILSAVVKSERGEIENG